LETRCRCGDEVWSAGDALQMCRRGGMERFGALEAYRSGGMRFGGLQSCRRVYAEIWSAVEFPALQARIRRGMEVRRTACTARAYTQRYGGFRF